MARIFARCLSRVRFSLYVFPSSSHFILFIFVFLCKWSVQQGGVFSSTCDSAPKKKSVCAGFFCHQVCLLEFNSIFLRVCRNTWTQISMRLLIPPRFSDIFFIVFFLKKKAVKLSTRHRRSHPSPNIFIEKNVARTSHWRRNAGFRLHLADWSYVQRWTCRAWATCTAFSRVRLCGFCWVNMRTTFICWFSDLTRDWRFVLI